VRLFDYLAAAADGGNSDYGDLSFVWASVTFGGRRRELLLGFAWHAVPGAMGLTTPCWSGTVPGMDAFKQCHLEGWVGEICLHLPLRTIPIISTCACYARLL